MAKPTIPSLATTAPSLATTAKSVGLETLRVLNVFDGAIVEAKKNGTCTPDYEKFIHRLKASHVANNTKLSATSGKPESVDLLYTIAEAKHLELNKGEAANQGYLKFFDALEKDIKHKEMASEIFSPTGHTALGKSAEEDLSRS